MAWLSRWNYISSLFSFYSSCLIYYINRIFWLFFYNSFFSLICFLYLLIFYICLSNKVYNYYCLLSSITIYLFFLFCSSNSSEYNYALFCSIFIIYSSYLFFNYRSSANFLLLSYIYCCFYSSSWFLSEIYSYLRFLNFCSCSDMRCYIFFIYSFAFFFYILYLYIFYYFSLCNRDKATLLSSLLFWFTSSFLVVCIFPLVPSS